MATLTARYEAEFPNSHRLHDEARTIFPAGVTHDLRSLEPFPIYVDRALGSRKWDVDGHELVDYWSGHGAILLGAGTGGSPGRREAGAQHRAGDRRQWQAHRHVHVDLAPRGLG